MALLFMMPLALITVMALLQDAPFRDYQELKLPVLYVDNDGSTLANSISKGILYTRHFDLVTEYKGARLTDSIARDLVYTGKYKLAIIVPKGATAEIINTANRTANIIMDKKGTPFALPYRESRDSIDVSLIFDPVAKKTFKTTITSAIEKLINQAQIQLLLDKLVAQLPEDSKEEGDKLTLSSIQSIGLREVNARSDLGDEVITNSVQHNVPAWSIFAMFFILIPIAGNMIREREDGSALRLRLLTTHYELIMIGKIAFYVLVCLIQFFAMMVFGKYCMPLLDLPALKLGNHPFALFLIGTAISMAATGYAVMIGSIFKTPNQAFSFGAISLVILSALGGIWIPVEIMPVSLQKLAFFNPLHWGLDAINELFLRGAGLYKIRFQVIGLVGFTLLTLAISLLVEKNNMIK